MQKLARPIFYICLWLSVALLTACSTAKNTAGSRFYHKVTANYNIYFNGSEAFKVGEIAQENGNQDNHTALIPMYMVGNKKTVEIGKGNFDTAIEKCAKAIKLHSIKRRPVWDANRRKTEKDKAFLARKEFNPFLKNAWMLMGQAQYQKGEFLEAASTFSYVARLYSTQPEVNSLARAWLARCYVEQDWLYDAEDVFNKLGRDSMSLKAVRTRDAAYANYLIKQKQFEEAIPYLERSIKYEKRKKQRARQYFLLGQLYRTVGDNANAYKNMKRVVRMSPPYELEFNARIQQTEVVAKGQSRQMIAKLQRMTKDQRNKDLLDQVYYAIGNIYLAQQDTVQTLINYEKGVKEGTRSGVEKGMLLLRLGEIYWAQEAYIDAERCYKQAIGMMEKESEEFAQAEWRAEVLGELAPQLTIVETQDSLQTLAKMPEEERFEVIDRAIEELKKKEKEEAREQRNADRATNAGSTGGSGADSQPGTTAPTTPTTGGGTWYFYSPLVVQQGKSEFARRWGMRENADDWRRAIKTVQQEEGEELEESEEAENQGELGEEAEADLGEEVPEEVEDASDPHNRAYYLAQIPLNEEQLAASNQALSHALYQAALLEKDRLENYARSNRTFARLYTEFPDFEFMPELYYNLFLLKCRLGEHIEAQACKNQLIAGWPDHKYSILLADPDYELNARYGKQREDSLYAASYEAYQANRYSEVMRNASYAKDHFAEGVHRGKFLFIEAMSHLYQNNHQEFLNLMKEVMTNHSKSEVNELATAYVKGIESGRALMSEKYDASSIWSRRQNLLLSDSTDMQENTLSDERHTEFVFLIAYPKDSINENALLFALARYNFSSFMVRNFEIEVEDFEGIGRMRVNGFLSYDEAHEYAQQLFGDELLSTMLKGMRTLVISEANLKLLGTRFSYDEYKEFYDERLAPLEIPEELILDSTTDLFEEQEEDGEGSNQQNNTNLNDEEEEYYDGYY